MIKAVVVLLSIVFLGSSQDTTKTKVNEYKKDLKIIQVRKQQLTDELKELAALERFHLYKIKSLTDSTRTKK